MSGRYLIQAPWRSPGILPGLTFSELLALGLSDLRLAIGLAKDTLEHGDVLRIAHWTALSL